MHKTSNRRSPKRHHSTITADKAFKMVIELTASIEKRNKRQRIDARTATPMATANSTSIMTWPTSATRIRDKRNNYNGFRNDYSLGEVARSSSHMITNMEQQPYSSENGHTQAIDASLRNHDYAFVKRSDGTYTYSVLAYRDVNTLAFVMCESCSIKLVKRQYWHDHVRLVSMEGSVMMMENGEDCSLSAMMATATIISGRLVPSKINNASRHSYHSPTANGRSYHQSPTFTLPKYEDTRVSMADAYSKTLAGDKIPQRIFIVSLLLLTMTMKKMSIPIRPYRMFPFQSSLRFIREII